MSLTDAIAFTATVLLFLVCVLLVEALFNVLAVSFTKDGRKPKYKRMSKSKAWKSKSVGTVTKMSETEKGLEADFTLHDVAAMDKVLWDGRPLQTIYKVSFDDGMTWHECDGNLTMTMP